MSAPNYVPTQPAPVGSATPTPTGVGGIPVGTATSTGKYANAYSLADAFLKSLGPSTYVSPSTIQPGGDPFAQGEIYANRSAQPPTPGTPSQALAMWQVQLIKAGLISPRAKLVPGLFDDVTLNATRKLYRFMDHNGMSDPYGAIKSLGDLQIDLSGGGGGRKGPQVPDFRPVDDATVTEYATKFAQGTLGRDFTARETARFSKVFRGLEKQGYQRDIQAFHQSGASVPQTTAEGIQQQEQQQLEQGGGPMAAEAGTYKLAQAAQIMGKAIG